MVSIASTSRSVAPRRRDESISRVVTTRESTLMVSRGKPVLFPFTRYPERLKTVPAVSNENPVVSPMH